MKDFYLKGIQKMIFSDKFKEIGIWPGNFFTDLNTLSYCLAEIKISFLGSLPLVLLFTDSCQILSWFRAFTVFNMDGF